MHMLKTPCFFMEFLMAHLLGTFLLYKYSALFVITIIEGPFITMFAGYIASQGMISLAIAYPLIVVGDLCSDSLFYALGYWGHFRIVKRFTSFAKISVPTSQRMDSLFHRHTIKTLFIAKITHAAGMPFLVAAGLAKVRYRKFLFANFLATLPKSMTFILIGYYYGEALNTISQYLVFGTWIVLGLMALTVLIYVFVGRFMYKKMLKENLLAAPGNRVTEKSL
jgi:membrane protein DedA with SNARE-associated domain